MKKIDCDQNSIEWMNARCGLPTASEFSKLITSTGAPSKSIEGYAEKLAGDFYAGVQLDVWEGNQYTEFGHELEQESVDYYEFNYEPTQTVGFITDDKGLYGCSPDRCVGKEGLLECKNLPKQHIKVLLYYKKHGRIPPAYIPQIQGQLFITGLKWCDSLFYSKHLPKLIVRHYPDLSVMAGLAKQLKECLALRDEIVEQLRSFDE